MTTNPAHLSLLADTAAAYNAGDVLAIHRFVTKVLGYKGGDAMRATRRYKAAIAA
jgi:hypothetical protein